MPCDYCGPVEPGGFATCCLVKCCKGPYSDPSIGEWCSGACPGDPSKGCNLDLTTTPHTCGCSSKCKLDTSGKNCTGGCDIAKYVCGFDWEGECDCFYDCASYKPDPSQGDSCSTAVCPVNYQPCVDDGKGGCKCLTCEDSLVSKEDGSYSCDGNCPDANKSCNINNTVSPPTCGCSSPCKFDTSTGKCTGGCDSSWQICHLDGSTECNCLIDCASHKPGPSASCEYAVCPGNDDECVDDGAGGCTCATPTPTPTPIPDPCMGLNSNQCSNSIQCKFKFPDYPIIDGHCVWCDAISECKCSANTDLCECHADACTKNIKCDYLINGEILEGQCKWDGTDCECKKAVPGVTPQITDTPSDTTTLQVAQDKKCGKTKPPTCGGECDDPDKVCVPKFSKKKNKMVCKCRKANSQEEDDSDEDEEDEEDDE